MKMVEEGESVATLDPRDLTKLLGQVMSDKFAVPDVKMSLLSQCDELFDKYICKKVAIGNGNSSSWKSQKSLINGTG